MRFHRLGLGFLVSSALISYGCSDSAPGASPAVDEILATGASTDDGGDSPGPIDAPGESADGLDGVSLTDGEDGVDSASSSDGSESTDPIEPPTFVLGRRTVAASAWLSCAIDSATEPGSVSCWGQHMSMVLSMPAPIGDTPERVLGIDDAVDIAVESDHVCAVRATGGVVCWGFNHYSQLGLPKDEVFHPVATAVEGVEDAVQVAVGNLHSCARLANGQVQCWGMAGWGQLGVPTEEGVGERAAPVLVPGVEDAVKIEAGGGHTCVLRADASVMCWGFNPFGEVGTGTVGDYPLPSVVQGVGPARDLALNGNGTWVLGLDGTVWYFGTHNSPQQIVIPEVEQVAKGAVKLDGAYNQACVTNAAGAVSCWSYWPLYRWGTGEANRERNQLAPEPSSLPLSELALGLTHKCGRTSAGDVVCWGQGALGQAGPGEVGQPTAIEAPVLLQNATLVSAYHDATCATVTGAAGGEVWCWGINEGGRLGFDEKTAVLPKRVSLEGFEGADAPAQDLAVGRDFSCLVAGGLVYCWGTNTNGQLGVLDVDTNAAAVPGLVDIDRVVLGDKHACALRNDGAVACWGANGLAQLGLGTYTDTEGPSWLSLASKALDITAGSAHTCAVLDTKEAYCWGLGKYGQLGVAVTPDATLIGGKGPEAYQRMYSRAAPQKLSPTQVVRIAASGDETCVAHASGVTCYGQRFGGEFGEHPVSGGDLSATRLILSPWGGCRLGAAGAACLGAFKALGAGQSGDTLGDAQSVALGSYACIVESNGDLRCYSDTDVQILAGTLDDYLTPVRVALPAD